MNATSITTQYLKHVVNTADTNPHLRQSLRTFHAVYFEIAKLELHKRGLPSSPLLQRVSQCCAKPHPRTHGYG